MRIRLLTSAGILVIAGLLMAVVLAIGPTAARDGSGPEVAFSPDNLLRLHVVANSDSEEDQALKLKVRDDILAAARELFRGVTSREEAIRIASENLVLIEEVAKERIMAEGKDYPVAACVGRFEFPDRTYGGVKVPAGVYDAVRVVIGKGAGANWWCILFPPLCLIDVEKDVVIEKVDVPKGQSPSVLFAFRSERGILALTKFFGGLWPYASASPGPSSLNGRRGYGPLERIFPRR